MSDELAMTTSELLRKMQAGCDDLVTYLKTLTPAQRSEMADAAGWTVKDHVMHLAVWEDSMNAMLEKKPRHVQMGVDEETWNSHDFDRINDVIQKQHRDKSWDAVLQAFADVHQRLKGKLEALTDADLQRPYREFQPDSTDSEPIIDRLIGNTYPHFEEHKGWIAVIAAGE